MNIIFGEDINELKQKYIVLELDTFRLPSGESRITYCLLENIPLSDFPVLEFYIKVHHDLMQAYRDRNWEYCKNAINGLRSKWGGELDSFYQDLAVRVNQLEQSPPAAEWDGSRTTSDHRDYFAPVTTQ